MGTSRRASLSAETLHEELELEDDDEDAPLTLEVPTRSTEPSESSQVGLQAPAGSSAIESPSPLTGISSPSPTNKPRKQSGASRRQSLLLGSSSSGSSGSSGSFPTPFKCCGDFCDFALQQPLIGTQGGGAVRVGQNPLVARFDKDKRVEATTALSLLFSSDERQIIGDQHLQQLLTSMHVAAVARPERLIDSASGANDLRVIAYKSIAFAKPNKQHLVESLQARARGSPSPNESPASPDRTDDIGKSKARRRSSLMDPTMTHAIREGYRSRLYGEMEGIANHYRQVRVCRNCYAIYTLLDQARELALAQPGLHATMEKQSANRRASVKAKWGAKVEEEVGRKQKLYLRQPTNARKPSVEGQTMVDTTLNGPASAPTITMPGLAMPQATSGALPALVSPKSHEHDKCDTDKPVSVSKRATSLPMFSPHLTTNDNAAVNATSLKAKESVVSMDKYLRGESKQIEQRELREGRLFHDQDKPRSPHGATTRRRTPASRGGSSLPIATVLVLDPDLSVLQSIHDTLKTSSSLPFSVDIESLTDANEALKSVKDPKGGYDLVLVERDLQNVSMTGLEFTKLVRQHEVQRSLGLSKTGTRVRTPIICLSSKTTAADLQTYKEAGMDGCVGKPISRDALVQTVQAALTKLLASSSSPSSAISAATDAIAKAKQEQLECRRKRRRRHEAAASMPFPGLLETDVRDYTHGVFQMDSETAFPYCILGDKHFSPTEKNTFFNLVVIHDLFDTWERLQILLNPIVTRYQGAVQILVWNYPGQAYTTWRPGALLNNSYHCECFQALLRHVGLQGKRYLRDAPYYLLGLGNGGNIATLFCSLSPPCDLNTRALVLVNSYSYVDAQLAQFLHDCLKVFACTPESRPDLPVYFHARFLFSAAYLSRVTTPLALNLYTAVMNPITLDGRKALCQGALNHKDLRKDRLRITVPFVSICASQDGLVNAAQQTQALVDATGVTLVDSIGKVLRNHKNNGAKRLSSVVWLAGGHEVMQECKQEMLLLLEQFVTGYHELNDTPHQPAAATTVSLSPPKKLPQPVEKQQRQQTREEDETIKAKSYEDTFIDRLLTTVNQVVPSSSPGNQLASPKKNKWLEHQALSATNAAHTQHQAAVASNQQANAVQKQRRDKQQRAQASQMTSWDPTTPAFERLSSNIIYKIGVGSKIYPDTKAMPEVKEYMTWRVQRNQKRLQRMEAKVRVIQRAFRAFYARTMAWRMKRERCAVQLQRHWRARMARKKYNGMKKEDWAVRLVQRNWRGKMGRDTYKQRMQQYLAAREIQRFMRGALARRYVKRVRERMRQSAVSIQRLVRQYLAKRRLFRVRKKRNAAVTIQRVYRGHLGRKRFQQEKDKLLFSKTQTQGITFGKQMLLEYKLYGTKLQSEVALLASTKVQVEKDAEAIVKEICEFEEGVRVLEMEMHALSQLETEGLSKQMNEQAKWQLREQKMRLDREFTQMLTQIATRKEKLTVMEEKLHQLDKERLTKEEELKGLERKLVILLDEQQKELEKIKHKQHTRSQLLLDIMPPGSSPSAGSPMPSVGSPWSSNSSASSPSKNALVQASAANSGTAFSAQQREEANSLMESTETMMKFGFMSMSMTYFSSMNMVRAMRKIGAHHMTLDSAAVVANRKWPEYNMATPTPGAVESPGFAPSPLGFQPAPPPGSFPGQQPLQVAGWSVADVGRWLDTLALGQYKRAFQDAAVDGALLLHLNDVDLKNTLGMEHSLHRKKVLTSVEQLRESERIKTKRLYGATNPDEMPTGGSAVGSPVSPSRLTMAAASPMGSSASLPTAASPAVRAAAPQAAAASTSDNSSGSIAAVASKMLVSFPDFCTLVRHGKLKQIKEALAHVPERKFDPLTVAHQYAPGVGTLYDDLLEKSAFHINKGDDNGNTPLLLAAQNNNLKVVQFLVSKGANPNHQNKHGQTAGHYAMAYSFFDLGAWLLDAEKGGGRDDILNENGLTAYDGLS